VKESVSRMLCGSNRKRERERVFEGKERSEVKKSHVNFELP
jgi:hypothetical protein